MPGMRTFWVERRSRTLIGRVVPLVEAFSPAGAQDRRAEVDRHRGQGSPDQSPRHSKLRSEERRHHGGHARSYHRVKLDELLLLLCFSHDTDGCINLLLGVKEIAASRGGIRAYRYPLNKKLHHTFPQLSNTGRETRVLGEGRDSAGLRSE